MSRESAKAKYTRLPGDPEVGYISPDDVMDAIDIMYDDMTNGPVVDADVAADADIARSKIAGTALTSDGMALFNVKDYGATGDDTADDTAELQAAITAAVAAAGTVLVPSGTYKITDALTVTGAVTITGTGTIHQVTSGKNGLTVTGDGVTVDGITLQGRHTTATYGGLECAISAAGASAAAPLERLTVRNVTIAKWGMYGVYLKYVTTFAVTGCDITMIGYCGVAAVSAIDGLISDNRIDDVIAGSGGNGYGVALSSEETGNLATDPRSADIVVRGNRVSNIPDWEGLDTHGGQRIVFAENVVLGCMVGIAVGSLDNGSNVETYAPLQITVIGNVIDSQVTDGTAAAGISFTGVSGGESATGTIVGNVIQRHGRQNDNIQGAMYLRSTAGLVVASNLMEEPSPFGICLYHDNTGFSVVGNAVTDVWSTTESTPSAIGVRAQNNSGIVVGNILRADGKSAAYVNYGGLYLTNGVTGTDVNCGVNDFGPGYSVINQTTATVAMRVKTDTVTDPYQILAGGNEGAPGYSFAGDSNTGFFPVGADSIGVAAGGARTMRLIPEGIYLEDGRHIYTQYGTGTMFPANADRKLGFWGATPVVQPAANADTSGASLGDLETEVNQLKALLRSIGLMAS